MHSKFIIKNQENRRLIIFFTGWSTDWKVLQQIHIPAGYDLLCCWNYSNIETPEIDKNYIEVVIIAWSFGVAAAEFLLPILKSNLNITGIYAVNGSRFPINDEKGIPVAMAQATLANLDERNLQKFKIRIAGGRDAYKKAMQFLNTDTSIQELKEELAFFITSSNQFFKNILWDYAFISENDKIFPLSNLLNVWHDNPFSVLKGTDHFPDFQQIFNLIIKDKGAIAKKFERSIPTYNENAKVQELLAETLIQKIKNIKGNFGNILEIGSGSGLLSSLIKTHLNHDEITLIDIGDISEPDDMRFLKGDAECLIHSLPSDSFDAVVSGATVQWFHSPTRFLLEAKRVLKKDGIIAFSTFLTGTFKEITSLSGGSLLYLSRSQWEMLARRLNLEIIESAEYEYSLEFDSVKDLFNHLKHTGVNSLSGKGKTISEMRNIMKHLKPVDGKYRLTYVSYIMLLN